MESDTRVPSVESLVGDDSLTVRELQRKLLLNRGYEVAVPLVQRVWPGASPRCRWVGTDACPVLSWSRV